MRDRQPLEDGRLVGAVFAANDVLVESALLVEVVSTLLVLLLAASRDARVPAVAAFFFAGCPGKGDTSARFFDD